MLFNTTKDEFFSFFRKFVTKLLESAHKINIKDHDD